jgi:hypothetical protein
MWRLASHILVRKVSITARRNRDIKTGINVRGRSFLGIEGLRDGEVTYYLRI